MVYAPPVAAAAAPPAATEADVDAKCSSTGTVGAGGAGCGCGGTAVGVVSLEDVLEELLQQEIEGEADRARRPPLPPAAAATARGAPSGTAGGAFLGRSRSLSWRHAGGMPPAGACKAGGAAAALHPQLKRAVSLSTPSQLLHLGGGSGWSAAAGGGG